MLSQGSLEVTWEGYSVTGLPAFPPGVFTNTELTVLARKVSKVTCLACKKICVFWERPWCER